MVVKNNKKLINSKFIKYLIPGVLLTMALRLTSVVDGVIIGNSLGSLQLAATGLASPSIFISQMPGQMMGVGAAIVCGRLIGNNDLKRAGHSASIALITTILLCLICTILAYPIGEPFARYLCDGTEELVPYIKIYLEMYWLTAPLIGIMLFFSILMAVDNHPMYSTISIIICSIVKILFMLIPLVFLNINGESGMYYAALSTSVGALASLVMVIPYFNSKKRLLKYSFKIEEPFKNLFEVTKSGLASGLTYILTGVELLVLSVNMSRALNLQELLVYGVISNIMFVVELFTAGIIQLIPTIIGVLYGQKDYKALKYLAKKMLIITMLITVFISAIIIIYPKIIIDIFGYEGDSETLSYVFRITRIYMLMYVFFELNKYMESYFPATGKNLPAVLVVLLRTTIIGLPFMVGLSYMNQLDGFSLGCVLNEIVTFFIVIIFVSIYYKIIKPEYKGLFLTPSTKNLDEYDVTLGLEPTDATIVSNNIYDYALKHGFNKDISKKLGDAAYKVIRSVQDKGYVGKMNSCIDINVKMDDGLLVLKIIDDGKTFEKRKVSDFSNDHDFYVLDEISHIIHDVDYVRVLNLNNTVIRLKKE